MAFLISRLFLQTKIMEESAVSIASLQMVMDVIIILWCALILRTIYNHKQKVCFLILKCNIVFYYPQFKYQVCLLHVSIYVSLFFLTININNEF